MRFTIGCTALALALLAGPAEGKGSARKSTKGSAGSANAKGSKGSGSAAGMRDLAFGCHASASQLRNWQPTAHVAGSTRQKFKRIGSFTSAGADGAAKRLCASLPPAAAVVPGPGKGGIVRGDIVVAQADVKVYRAYSKAPFACGFSTPAAELGGWWSFEPFGPKAAYRKKNAICPSWNDFSMKVSCTLKKGTAVIVGATETAHCVAGDHACPHAAASFKVNYPRSATAQVFINTRSSERGKYLTNCSSGPWQ